MKGFAETDIVYPDGQKNKETIPAEIQAQGFKPPVKLPDGSIQDGNRLTANHLNFLLNDLYSQLGNSAVVVESAGNSSAGYKKFANGDVEMWGRGTPNTTGDTTINYPVAMPGATRDIQATSIMGATIPLDIHVTMIVDASPNVTGFRAKSVARLAAGSANVASQAPFNWRAFYHAEVV